MSPTQNTAHINTILVSEYSRRKWESYARRSGYGCDDDRRLSPSVFVTRENDCSRVSMAVKPPGGCFVKDFFEDPSEA